MNRPIPVALSTLTLALLLAFPAQSETTSGDTATNTANLPRVEVSAEKEKTYVVKDAGTGTKTDTPILETPLSIQVIPHQVLQDQNATTLSQALRNVSGVKSSDNYGLLDWKYLRGFPTNVAFRNGFRIEESVGTGILNMSNIDSIEVLKGPAAILYGRVEPGGIVNMVTKKPEATPSYSIEQQVGSWDHYLTNLDATGPVNEDKTVLYRINASYEKSNSWRDSVSSERQFIAPTLQWKISPKTQVTLEAEYNHAPFTYDAAQVLPYDTLTNQLVQLPRNQNLGAGSTPSPADKTYLGMNWSHQFNDDWAIKHQIVHYRVTNSSDKFYAAWAFNQVSPTAWTADIGRTYWDSDNTQTATILDLTGHFDTAGLKHTLLIGADYYKNDEKYSFGYSSFASPSTTDAFHPTPPVGLNIDPTTISGGKTSADHYGVYVQDQIKLPNNIHVLAGLRSQRVSTTGSNTDASGVTTPNATQSDSAVTPRFGLLWRVHDWLSLYGNYAENFGANTGRDWQGKNMKPESAQQKEVGVKAEFFGGKLRTSLAYFELTKQNVATADKISDPTGVFGYKIAIGEVRSKGSELDIQGEIQQGWDVIASYGHTDIRVTKSNNGDIGLRMADVPKDVTSLWTTYKLKGEALLGWKIGGGATWQSSTTDSTNTIDTPAYSLVDAMVAYEFKTGKNKVTAQLNINNLFNKTYYMNAIGYGSVRGMEFGTPRSATASMKVEF